MQYESHKKVTGFSGNEIFCLNKLGFTAGQLCVGNEVVAIGALGVATSTLANIAGGEITRVTELVHEGRKAAFERMMQEVRAAGGAGLAGVSFDMINQGGNLEFISLGSVLHHPTSSINVFFSTSSSGQNLYAQMDAGFNPHSFVFGNVAYSIGVGGGLKGLGRSLIRGEVKEFTEIYNSTRHLALSRIKEEAKLVKANAVIGIETNIMSLYGAQEMIMVGTAATHPNLNAYQQDPVTSSLTNVELWNLVNLGYLPIKMVIGVSVYSLGFGGSLKSVLGILIGGKIDTMTQLLYEAREKALARIQADANECGADEVVGAKTYIFDMGGGLVEFMVIGTAVKKFSDVTTKNPQILPQAIIEDRDTVINSEYGSSTTISKSSERSSIKTQFGIFQIIGIVIFIMVYVYLVVFKR
ncbi:MAG: heavy metal-binding domain-containing protein [Gammaproteobacteria bacterium]|nr:heavy metal-binding domain-containing protein [Gammaproteobacteria bacterium]